MSDCGIELESDVRLFKDYIQEVTWTTEVFNCLTVRSGYTGFVDLYYINLLL